jgi:Ni/Co efflux regulator RcnB
MHLPEQRRNLMASTVRNALFALFCVTLAFQAPSAWASGGHGGKNKKHREYEKHEKHRSSHNEEHREHERGHHGEDDDYVSVEIRFGDSDRGVIHRYLSDHYRPYCPPGLAKKRNGCRSPGHTKRYFIGRPIAREIWQPVPYDLFAKLRPAPAGHRYVMVDRDVLLISEASHNVIDAITLLSAVGN